MIIKFKFSRDEGKIKRQMAADVFRIRPLSGHLSRNDGKNNGYQGEWRVKFTTSSTLANNGYEDSLFASITKNDVRTNPWDDLDFRNKYRLLVSSNLNPLKG